VDHDAHPILLQALKRALVGAAGPYHRLKITLIGRVPSCDRYFTLPMYTKGAALPPFSFVSRTKR